MKTELVNLIYHITAFVSENSFQNFDSLQKALQDANLALEKTEEPVNTWISVKDRLWETQREVESLQSEKRKLELTALFEYLPIGSEYIVSGYKSVAGINYRGGDKIEIFKKNPRSVVLKWIQMYNPNQSSSTTSKKENVTYHRIDIDKFFDMLMSDSSEFVRGFKTYLTRKSTLEELGL